MGYEDCLQNDVEWDIKPYYTVLLYRDVTKFAFEFDKFRFKILGIFHVPVIEFELRSTRSAPHVYAHRPPEQPIEQMRAA